MRGTTLLRVSYVSWYQCHFRCPSWIHLAVSLDSFHFECLGFAWIFLLPSSFALKWLKRQDRIHAHFARFGQVQVRKTIIKRYKKITGRHHRNTIFLQVLSDRAFHSSWPMFFFIFILKNSHCSCVSQFPWVTVKLEFSYDGFHLYIPLYCQNVEIKRQCGTRTRGQTAIERSFGVHSFLHILKTKQSYFATVYKSRSISEWTSEPGSITLKIF